MNADAGNEEPTADEKTIAELLHDEKFEHLWSEANERYIEWDEFKSLEMPGCYSPAFIWKTIYWLRECAGRFVPTPHGLKPWHNLPLEGRREIWAILARSDEASVLNTYLLSHDYLTVDVQAQVDELVWTLAHDGYSLGYESVREIMFNNRKPHSDAEKIVKNYFDIVLDELHINEMDEKTSAVDVMSLFRRFVDGTGYSSDVDNHGALQVLVDAMKLTRQPDAAEVLTLSANIFDSPYWNHPFASLNATFGSLARKVFFIRSGRPVLSLLPLTREMTREQRLYPEPLDPCHTRPDLWGEDGISFDLTPYFLVYLRKVTGCLDTLERYVSDSMERESDLRAMVRNTHMLNHRQRDVLLAGLDDPSSEFDYASHQEIYQVAYATARADLMGLANHGYLKSEVHSNRNVYFHISPDMSSMIEMRLG